MYAVVEFLNSDNESTGQISVVPLIWVHKLDSKCYWPIRTNKVPFHRFVKNLTPFKKSWPSYRIKIHLKTASYKAAEDALKNILNENPESTDSVRSMQQKAVECQSESDSSDYEEGQATANSESLVYLSEHEIQRNTVDVREYQLTGVPSTSSSCSLTTPVDVREYQLTAVPSTSTSTTQHTSEFETTVLNLLTQMMANINQHSILLSEINRHTSSINSDKLIAPQNLPEFPLQTNLDFLAFDQQLQCEPVLKEYMVRRLAALGGVNIENLTRRILKYILTDEVAVLYNWKGRDKLSFEKTNVMQVVYAAVRSTFSSHDVNELKIANAVKDWLKYARLRMGKKSNK